MSNDIVAKFFSKNGHLRCWHRWVIHRRRPSSFACAARLSTFSTQNRLLSSAVDHGEDLGRNSACSRSLSQIQWLTAFSSAWELKSSAVFRGLLLKYSLTSRRRTFASSREVTSSDFLHGNDDNSFISLDLSTFGRHCFQAFSHQRKRKIFWIIL